MIKPSLSSTGFRGNFSSIDNKDQLTRDYKAARKKLNIPAGLKSAEVINIPKDQYLQTKELREKNIQGHLITACEAKCVNTILENTIIQTESSNLGITKIFGAAQKQLKKCGKKNETALDAFDKIHEIYIEAKGERKKAVRLLKGLSNSVLQDIEFHELNARRLVAVHLEFPTRAKNSCTQVINNASRRNTERLQGLAQTLIDFGRFAYGATATVTSQIIKTLKKPDHKANKQEAIEAAKIIMSQGSQQQQKLMATGLKIHAKDIIKHTNDSRITASLNTLDDTIDTII